MGLMVFGALMMAGGFASVIYGNYMNNDFSTQLAHYYSEGNPGDPWMFLGVIAIIIGILLFVCGTRANRTTDQSNVNANDPAAVIRQQLNVCQNQRKNGQITEEEYQAKRDELLKELSKYI